MRDSSDGNIDWVPSTFSPEIENLEVIPLKRDEPWETIRLHSSIFSPRLILGIFPAFLQLDIRFHFAVRTLGMEALSVAPEQMRGGLALVESMDIGGIVLTKSAFLSTTEELRSYAPDSELYFQIVLGPDEQPLRTEQKNVFHEVHLVPGVVGLYQCASLASSVPRAFHMSNRFEWEREDDDLFVCDRDARFARTRFPQKATVVEKNCACGEARYAVL